MNLITVHYRAEEVSIIASFTEYVKLMSSQKMDECHKESFKADEKLSWQISGLMLNELTESPIRFSCCNKYLKELK